MRALQFIVILSLVFNSPCSFANETSSGGSGRSRHSDSSDESGGRLGGKMPESVLKRGQCPAPLKQSVLGDYGGQSSSTPVAFNVSSFESKKCSESVAAYQKFINENSSSAAANSLRSDFSRQFSSVISDDVKPILEGCVNSGDLTPNQAIIAQTRFYANAVRIEKMNKSILDEIAYLDSINPGSSELEKIECYKLMPDLKKRCEDLKALSSKCQSDKAKRFDEQVDQTIDALDYIQSLKNAEQECKKERGSRGKCDNYSKAIELVKDDVPWIRGEVFEKIARDRSNPRSSAVKYFGRDKIKDAMQEQFNENAAALTKAYSDNLGNFRCLYNEKENGQSCNISNVRSQVINFDEPTEQSDSTPQAAQQRYFLEAENCFTDRARTHTPKRDSNAQISLTGLKPSAAAEKVMSGMSRTMASSKSGAFASAKSIQALLVGNSSKQAYSKCMQTIAPVLEGISLSAKQNHMMCDTKSAPLAKARKDQNHCLVTALLEEPSAVLADTLSSRLSGSKTQRALEAAAYRAAASRGPASTLQKASSAVTSLGQTAAQAVQSGANTPVAATPEEDFKLTAQQRGLRDSLLNQQASATNAGNTVAPVGQAAKLAVVGKQLDPKDVSDAISQRAVRVNDANGEPLLGARIAGVTRDAQGNLRAEIMYQKPDGSMASQFRDLNDVYVADPTIGRKIAQLFGAPQAIPTKTGIAQQARSVTASGSSLDLRGGSAGSSSSMASAAAAPASSGGGGGGSSGGFQKSTATASLSGSNVSSRSDGGVGSTGGSGRSPASVGAYQGSSQGSSAEEDLVLALQRAANKGSSGSTNYNAGSNYSGNSSFAARSNSYSSGSTSSFGSSSNSVSNKNSPNVKSDKGSDGVIDKTTNARFVEGEMIRVPKFEDDKDADFKVLKKLDNGLLRVVDTEKKEFDLMRDEVKRAIRLSLNGAPDPMLNTKPLMTPAKIGQNMAPGELMHVAKIEKVQLKQEYVQPGDQVRVLDAQGVPTLKAKVVRKNTDGSVLVADDLGQEISLSQLDAENAQFMRQVDEDVQKNLVIVNDADRITAARKVVARQLTPKEEAAIIQSHKIAEDKGLYTLASAEIAQKTEVLQKAGFSDDEAQKLLQKGVAVGTGVDNVRIVADKVPVPKFDIVKGQQIQIPVAGRKNPGAVMSGPDEYGSYEVEYFEKGVGINRTRKTAKELIEANVAVIAQEPNPLINVPIADLGLSYPGKVVSGPNSKGDYNVEIYPQGKPSSVITVSEVELKRANTPTAIYKAQERDARLAEIENKSSAELEQLVRDSLQKQKILKTKKIDIEGHKALEVYAQRQKREAQSLLSDLKSDKESSQLSLSDIYNSPQAEGARNEIKFLAEQDGLNGEHFTEVDREKIGRELGLDNPNQISAIEYGLIAGRQETRNLFNRIFKGIEKSFDPEILRRTMSYNPGSGFVGDLEFSNAQKFVNDFKSAKVSDLTVAERRLLNKFTDRAPLYARQAFVDTPLIVRQFIENNDSKKPRGQRQIASVNEVSSAGASARASLEDADKTSELARKQLDFLADQDGLKASRLSERDRESVARELGIYDQKKTKALVYNRIGKRKEVSALFDKVLPGARDFDLELLRQTMSFSPSTGVLTTKDYSNAARFVAAIQKADIDGSNLSLSERQLLNRFTNRAPLYAQQVLPETALITPQSLEAVVPPKITHNKVTSMAARGDEIIGQVNIKPEMVRSGDQVQLKNFEGGADLNAYFVKKNKDGTIRVKDSRGKEFNLGQQATLDVKFYRGLTAELKANGDLDISSRQKAAEGYVKRPLTQAQKNAIQSSYEVGGKEKSFFDYTLEEQQQKTNILRKAGFTLSEANLLVRKGVVGNNPSVFSQVLKVNPHEVRLGDRINIDDFKGTGELRGEIIAPARNGGLLVRDENGAETVLYKEDIENSTNVRITRDAHRRTIASTEGLLSLDKTAIKAPLAQKAVPLEASEVRVGDRVVISNFQSSGELDAIIVNASKNGRYIVRAPDGSETILYKADLEDKKTVKLSREWGLKTPDAKVESAGVMDFSADSTLLVAKDYKNNPEIVVPLGNGDYRLGRVIVKLDPKPGMPKTFTVEYADEAGITNQMNLTQEQLLAASTPEALKKVKEDLKRSAEYQTKTDEQLRQLLDEGHRAAKDALGKGRTVDKKDLNAESQSALAELARRNSVTSRSVFETYRRGGIKAVEALASRQTTSERKPASLTSLASNTSHESALEQIKTADFVVTAGIGDKIKLPKNGKTESEGVILAREKVNGEVLYTVGVKKSDKVTVPQKLSAREVGTSNPQFVGLKPKNNSQDSLQKLIEQEFKDRKLSAPDVSNVVMLDGSSVAFTKTDDAFVKLFQDVSGKKTSILAEVNKAANRFSADKKSLFDLASSGKLGAPSNLLRNQVEAVEQRFQHRQKTINDVHQILDLIDESLGSLVAKDAEKSGHANMTVWEITLLDSLNKDLIRTLNFSTSVNLSRSEALAQIKEFSAQERLKLLSAQSQLEYDQAYFAEFRTVVGATKRPPPLPGGSVFANFEGSKLDTQNSQLEDLKNDLDSAIAIRGRRYGLRAVLDMTPSHPLTPVVEKQRQLVSRLNIIDRQLQPENFAKVASRVANELVLSGDMDLAIPYFRVSAMTIYDSLGASAKGFWNSEANTQSAIKAGFISDNYEVAHLALERLISLKSKVATEEGLKKVALDYYHNLNYEYERILFGVKRYGNKNKELDLLVIRKQQQFLSEKYQLRSDIEAVSGKESWQKMNDQAQFKVMDILMNPKQIVDHDSLKNSERVPAATPAAMTTPAQSKE